MPWVVQACAGVLVTILILNGWPAKSGPRRDMFKLLEICHLIPWCLCMIKIGISCFRHPFDQLQKFFLRSSTIIYSMASESSKSGRLISGCSETELLKWTPNIPFFFNALMTFYFLGVLIQNHYKYTPNTPFFSNTLLHLTASWLVIFSLVSQLKTSHKHNC